MLKNALLVLVSLTLALFAGEWILGRFALGPGYAKAKQMGVPYDTRERIQVLVDNRRSDPNWYSVISGNIYLKNPLFIDGKRVLPLGGVASAHLVGCNEGGFHSTLRSDEAGFPNPFGTWPLREKRYVFTVGDSYTEGACVNEGDSIADNLRKRNPDVVNLGMRGNGPLLELASIREYIPSGRVADVFWLYTEENDLRDLHLRESKSEVLVRYLEEGFSQNLWQRQKEVNERVRALLEEQIQSVIKERIVTFPHLTSNLKKLWYSRGAKREVETDIVAGEKDLQMFMKILRIAKDEVTQKGGRLIFVYVPGRDRFTGGTPPPEAQMRDQVLSGVRALAIPIVDLLPALSRHSDPASLFPLRMAGHYTAEGYGLIAVELSEFQKRTPVDTH
jgi:hypothetical protein